MSSQDALLSPLDRGLRKATIATFPFAFALCIAHAAVAHNVLPAITLVPMTASTALSVIWVYVDKVRQAGGIVKNGRPKHKAQVAFLFFLDFLAGAGLLTALIFCWILMPQGSNNWYYYDAHYNRIMLGTYATVPSMINFTIHAFFVFRPIYNLIPSFPAATCPHCHHNLSTGRVVRQWCASDLHGHYAPVAADETESLYRDDGRPSMDQRQETGVTTEDLTGDADADIATEISASEVQRATLN
ncbi:hypothetical protein P154DRAFT_623518 [Amniculicola lignicola CBS 123094]|uniref:Uncharacterized protein n=1 Tax=Amniculicola lignicola CBS 123094 TaxID=1392246 RepID=A0A6A5W255_9PLEO|nr:hypothetical protein P154DRAFT_623518 [Amniculicola lignicola CBS 123094]